MERFNFISGSYAPRSKIAAFQRCVNYYPEINPRDSAFPITCYQRPGLRRLANATGQSGWRGIWEASNGLGYGVCGNKVYYIDQNFALTTLGTITPGRTNPCSFVDNGAAAFLVDGSPSGWTWNITTTAGFAAIIDGSGTFQGADRVDILDTYMIWNMPGGPFFGSTLSNTLAFDPLYFAGKVSYPDPLQTLIVNRLQLLLFGRVKSENWYNAGNTQFPFARLPGTYIEHGIAAKYSVSSNDISTFWLGKNKQGFGMVYRYRGYETKIISNPAISYALRKMQKESTIEDAIGYCYLQDGHQFYMLHFPTADQTWVFDDTLGEPMMAWHQQAWSDTSGRLHRHRGNCFASLYGRNICGDWENGNLYEMDPDYYYDDKEVSAPSQISCIRGFPHLLSGNDSQGRQTPSHGRSVMHNAFWASMDLGNADNEGPEFNQPAKVSLRWSDDWGKSWGNAVLQSAGKQGEFKTVPQWAGLGTARFRLYELFHTIPAEAALNGAWIEGRLQETNR